MKLIRGWRQHASANADSDTRTTRFGVRELRPAHQHTNAREAQEKGRNEAKEAGQGKNLAFALTAPLALGPLSLLGRFFAS
jgi:hypothetical protein